MDGNRQFSFLVVIILLLAMFIGVTSFNDQFIGTTSGAVLTVDIAGGGNYTKIQDAIDNASAGDTILVWAGTYNEKLVIDKAISIIGNGSSDTIISGDSTGHVIYVTANAVNFTGLTITKSGNNWRESGIYLYYADYCRIDYVNLTTCYFGIMMWYADYTQINYINVLSSVQFGISGYYSTDNIIENNTITTNQYDFYYEQNCHRNIIRYNNFSSSSYMGMYANNCDYLIFEWNNISNHYYGLQLQNSDNAIIKNNTAISNRYIGIYQSSARNCVFENNTFIRTGLLITGWSVTDWTSHSIDFSNTVNGKPILYWKDVVGGSVPPGAGQIILANCDRITVDSVNYSDGGVGISLGHSDYINVTNNTCSRNSYAGVYIYNSNYCRIENNSLQYNYYSGIYFESGRYNDICYNYINWTSSYGIYIQSNARYNDIYNNTCYRGSYGMYFNWGSQYNNIYRNNCTLTTYGIRMYSTQYFYIHNNTFSNNNRGMYIYYSRYNVIENNICDWNSRYGMEIYNENYDNIFYNNSCSNNSDHGIYMRRNNARNIFTNNDCNDNSDIGIYLYDNSRDNTFINNNMNRNNQHGIYFNTNCDSNTVINNTINDNTDNGIYMYNYCSDINIINNTINDNDEHGIRMSLYCSNTRIENNNIILNTLNGLYIQSYSSNTKIINNDIASNGNYGLYFYDYTDNNIIDNNSISMSGNSGIYISTNSRHNIIINNILTQNTNNAIHVYQSINNTINNNSCFMNDYGINISYSDNNTITNNDCIFISNYGMNIFHSNNNTIDNNNCSNTANGIFLEYSKNNSITNNQLYSVSNVGMWLDRSKNNTLFNNTVFANFAGFQIFFNSDNNTIMNNTSPTGQVGLYMGMSSNNTCINNNWSSHLIVNVYLLMNSNNNTIVNNKCDTSQYAIVLQDSSYNTIEDNNCQNTLLSGIYLISPSNYNIIHNNDLRNTDGIILLGSWNTVSDNTIEVNKPAVHGITVQPTSHNCSIFNNKITTKADGAMGIYSLANNDLVFNNNDIKTFGNRSFGMFLDNDFRMTHRNNNINVYGRETAGMVIQNCEGNIYGSKINSWGVDSPSVTIIFSNVSFYSANVLSTNNVSFNLSVNSEVLAQTCNFNTVNIIRNDLTSNLTIINSLRISVNYSAPYFTPVPDVEVNVTNNGQIVYRTPGYNGTDKKTNMNGKTSGILVLSHKYIWSETATYYPTNIELKKDIQGRHWDDIRNNIDMTTSHIEYFEPDIDIAAPLPPANIVVESFPDGQALKLTWDDVPNVNLYRLYWNDTGDMDGSFVEIQQVNSNTTNVLDLIDYHPYAFKIQCRDTSDLWGDLSLSEAVIGIPMDTQPPATPTGLTVTMVTSTFVNLSWDANSEADLEGYELYRFIGSGSPKLLVKTTNTWYNDTTVFENKNYSYTISAYDEVPNFSPPSDPVNAGIIPILPPKVIDKSPSNGATNVPIGAIIEVTFNKGMHQGSVESAFSISPPVKGTFEWSNNGRTFTFIHAEKLAYNTQYTITISTDAKDKKFNYAMPNQVQWSFTTELDLYPPTVLDHGPTGNDVRVTTVIFIEFSEAMDKDSTEGAFVLTPNINGTFAWEGNLMVFSPDTPLEYNTTYKVELRTTAKDTADNSLAAHNWEFTTLNATSSPPEVISHSPIGSGIPVDTEVRVEFLKPMNKKATQTAFGISPSVPGGKFSWDGNELIFNHGDFKTNTTYTVTIRSSAMDTDGNRMPGDFSWEFITSEIGIYRPPKIIAISPEPNSKVEINTKIRITFNKAITNDLATMNVRKIGADLLNGTVEFNDAKTEISFMLPAGKYLDYSSNYYVSFIGMEIDTGSFNLSIGNLTYSWEFSTKSESEADSDKDTMDDEWENDNGLNPFNKNDATGDLDSDDLNNVGEYDHKTDPNNNDTDSDGLEDGLEVTLYLTDPADDDSDDDDWTDGAEVEAETNPLDADDHPEKKKKKEDEPALLLILAIIIIIVIIVIIALMLMLRAKKPKPKPKASKEVQQKQKNEDIKKKIKGDAQNEPVMNRK